MRTKSQKIAAGLLGLAVVAFVVDRWMIGTEGDPDASARAALVRPSAAPAKPAARQGVVPATTVVAQPPAQQPTSLASRLAAMDEAMRLSREAVADAFRPSDAWLAAAAPPVAPVPEVGIAPPPAAAPKIDHAAVFSQHHTLTAVMNSGKGGMAIVNGKLYKVGQRVGGFTLIDVGLTEAVFLGKRTEATLKLAGQAPAGAGADVQ